MRGGRGYLCPARGRTHRVLALLAAERATRSSHLHLLLAQRRPQRKQQAMLRAPPHALCRAALQPGPAALVSRQSPRERWPRPLHPRQMHAASGPEGLPQHSHGAPAGWHPHQRPEMPRLVAPLRAPPRARKASADAATAPALRDAHGRAVDYPIRCHQGNCPSRERLHLSHQRRQPQALAAKRPSPPLQLHSN